MRQNKHLKSYCPCGHGVTRASGSNPVEKWGYPPNRRLGPNLLLLSLPLGQARSSHLSMQQQQQQQLSFRTNVLLHLIPAAIYSCGAQQEQSKDTVRDRMRLPVPCILLGKERPMLSYFRNFSYRQGARG